MVNSQCNDCFESRHRTLPDNDMFKTGSLMQGNVITFDPKQNEYSGYSVGLHIVDFRAVETGGAEPGVKAKVLLEDETGETRPFFLKEMRDRKSALNLIDNYAVLGGKKLPVPPEVYYIKIGNRHFFATTDLSDGGKYPVWGINKNETREELADLLRLSPGKEDLEDAMHYQIFEPLSGANVLAWIDTYLLRRNAKGRLEIFIVDAADVMTYPMGAVEKRLKEATAAFVDQTLFALARARKGAGQFKS